MTWRGKTTFEEMRQEQIRMLEDVQGYRCEGDIWVGEHYKARITDRPGATATEMWNMGFPVNGPPDEFSVLVIEYYV